MTIEKVNGDDIQPEGFWCSVICGVECAGACAAPCAVGGPAVGYATSITFGAFFSEAYDGGC